MPLLLILAFLAAAYLISAPDPVTLRATRGAAGAIAGAIRPGGAATRTARPSPRSTRTRSPRPAPPRSGRPASRIGAAIRGGIRSADRAEAKRTDLRAAIEELIDRGRRRRQARQVDRAEQDAHDENDRRDRAAERDRIRGGVKQIAEQMDPAPEPAQPEPARARIDQTNGDPVAQPDLTHIALTELDTLDQLSAEVGDASHLIGHLAAPVDELHSYLRSLAERYASARDLWKTIQMDACVALLDERNFNALRNELDKAAEQLGNFTKAIEKAKADVEESDARSGRVESARAR